MSSSGELTKDAAELAEAISERVQESGQSVAAAESLTSGNIASHLGAAPQASEWFAGGVVAYASQVKFEVLGVEPGPVVTAQAARQMAAGVARLTGADVAVATTGAGGPDPQDGQEPGTVFIGVSSPGGVHATEHHFDGEPADVVHASTVAALQHLLDALSRPE
ncbi:CinA domain protein [Kribbella flavida DSM 17836]|uniref:CinA domain protein n=1 Tax=Kribbella flavida (strain DSM 17836 / JCM 10339 / NBRC 14399) TaxID=479435 RepID=D2PTX1_KRIFD|nr:CinA family protein [Kribbella flavida]ADB33254.1 CinA domain protein [Kribbella flavida DSM 17836]